MAETLVAARFSDEDVRLLEACVEIEQLKKSDILRRAVRHYAEHLGVKLDQRSKPKRKK